MRGSTIYSSPSLVRVLIILLLPCSLSQASPFPADNAHASHGQGPSRDVIDRTNETPDAAIPVIASGAVAVGLEAVADSPQTPGPDTIVSVAHTPKQQLPEAKHITHKSSSNFKQPPCAFPKWVVSQLVWSNSSNHLDCDPRSKSSSKTYNAVDPLCHTGLSKQPAGHSPPAVFSVDIDPLGRCKQSNPGSVPPRRIGDGYIRCGSSAPSLFFRGNSNEPRSKGLFRVNEQFACQEGRISKTAHVYSAWGEAEFQLICKHDSFRNATCTSEPLVFEIPLLGWKAISGKGRIVDGVKVEPGIKEFLESGRTIQLID